MKSRRGGSSSKPESAGQRRPGRESSPMGKSKWRRSGRGFDGSNTRSDGSETEDRRNNAERAGGCERGEEGNWERGMDLHSKKTRNFESEGRFVVGRRDSILEGDLRLSTLSAVKSNVFFGKFKVKSNGKKSEVQRVLDFTFFTVGLHFLLK